MDMSYTTEVMAISVICFNVCLCRPKFGCHGNVPYTLAIRNVFFGLANHENPVICNQIVDISRRKAFVAILVLKFVAMVTRFCTVYTGVSQMNSPIAQTLSQNQTRHGYFAYNKSYCHFCDIFSLFWPKFGCHGNVP